MKLDRRGFLRGLVSVALLGPLACAPPRPYSRAQLQAIIDRCVDWVMKHGGVGAPPECGYWLHLANGSSIRVAPIPERDRIMSTEYDMLLIYDDELSVRQPEEQRDEQGRHGQA